MSSDSHIDYWVMNNNVKQSCEGWVPQGLCNAQKQDGYKEGKKQGHDYFHNHWVIFIISKLDIYISCCYLMEIQIITKCFLKCGRATKGVSKIETPVTVVSDVVCY